jgi:two-component system nitrate/nitrite response regulator NarL
MAREGGGGAKQAETRGGVATSPEQQAGRQSVPVPRATGDVKRRLRVVVVAGASLIGESIRETLGARGFDVLSVAVPSGQRALRDIGRTIAASRPGVGLVVSDLSDPVEVGDIDQLLVSVPLRWLVLTSEPAGPQWGALLEAGAAAILPTNATLDELRRALLWVAMGREVMPPGLSARVLDEWRETRDAVSELAERLESLTPREMAVLGSLSDGKSVKDIAEQVGVSEGTVRSQVKAILRKLGVRSQLASVAAYRQLDELRRRSRRSPHNSH